MAKADITLRARNYSIACAPGQEERIIALARELDLRMEDIKGAVGDVGHERLLLLTVLAVLDELDAATGGGGLRRSTETEAAGILDTVAERIEALANRFERPD